MDVHMGKEQRMSLDPSHCSALLQRVPRHDINSRASQKIVQTMKSPLGEKLDFGDALIVWVKYEKHTDSYKCQLAMT